MSYGTFARKLGISKPTVYAIERETRAPSFEMIEKIQRKLKVSLVEIFGEAAYLVPGRCPPPRKIELGVYSRRERSSHSS